MSANAVTLDDKYDQLDGRVFLTGTQALVRLVLMQARLDAAAGLNTGGFVTGYRGSPLGNVDREMWRAAGRLGAHGIKFQPGVNEDLAATAVWGSQQTALASDATKDGVFALWYGKGPGVDRSGDVFRHGNLAGTAALGGVLVLAGDDPACKSSTVPSQSEYALMDAQIPVFNPANVQDLLDYGLIGWAMSRYAGLWVGMKTITENMDSSASADISPGRVQIKIPNDFEMPDSGVHIRWPDSPLDQEMRLQRHKVYAALAFARANGVNRVTLDSPNPRFGIVSTGKSYLDTLQALDDLGIDEAEAAAIGIRLYKVGMSWPLERDGIRHFAEGLDEILVVEEKRAVIENQIKEQLYNWREDVRPRVVGKFDEAGGWMLPSAGELTPAGIARVVAARIGNFYTSPTIKQRLEFLERKEKMLEGPRPGITRIPYFCAGCPHNTSTRVPDGSTAVAGIGCHYMALWMDRKTETFTQMGGEGANWIGQAPFVERDHVFVNLGDGTYFHSGLLAIRAAVAAGVNITYKILFNDAVAMTGGQPMDGPLDVPRITRQVAAEGVKRVVVVSDEPTKYPIGSDFAPGVSFHDRHDLDAVQRDLRGIEGVTVLVYDQVCAAEKRRRRKRGKMPDPARRIFINEAVCEGCGDCGVVSNCVAIAPSETPDGRKRRIDQSACNKDYSCADGFCPSFVSVIGGMPRKAEAIGAIPFAALPAPARQSAKRPYGILITGIGGTGVVTIGALLGMAAHIEGMGVSVLDMTGLAQKNGAVTTHVRIAEDPGDLKAVRIAAGGARLLIGCDFVTAGGADAIAKLRDDYSKAVINDHATMTAAFTHDADLEFPGAGLRGIIDRATQPGGGDYVDATGLAMGLMGDSIASNLLMVGYALQKGLLPLSEDAILAAIELNGVAVDFNKQAFMWGRRAAHDLAAVEHIAGVAAAAPGGEDLDATIKRRAGELTAYQDAGLAARYRAMVERVRQAERKARPGSEDLARAVGSAYFKLLAYKDEYEVARLYSDGRFASALKRQFAGDLSLRFHLAPPLLAGGGGGVPRKRSYGPWMMRAFGLLARLKGLRGTAFDPFGRTAERRAERALITDFEQTLETLLGGLNAGNLALATEIAGLPETIRGFGHVKVAAMAAAKETKRQLLGQFNAPDSARPAAE